MAEFTPEVAEEVCAWIAEGKSLRAYCARAGKVSKATIMRHLVSDPEFRAMYEIASEMKAEAYAEETVDIADREPDPQRAKVRISSRQWMAERLLAKKYGPRVGLDHGGKVGLVVEVTRFTDAEPPVAD